MLKREKFSDKKSSSCQKLCPYINRFSEAIFLYFFLFESYIRAIASFGPTIWTPSKVEQSEYLCCNSQPSIMIDKTTLLEKYDKCRVTITSRFLQASKTHHVTHVIYSTERLFRYLDLFTLDASFLSLGNKLI